MNLIDVYWRDIIEINYAIMYALLNRILLLNKVSSKCQIVNYVIFLLDIYVWPSKSYNWMGSQTLEIFVDLSKIYVS